MITPRRRHLSDALFLLCASLISSIIAIMAFSAVPVAPALKDIWWVQFIARVVANPPGYLAMITIEVVVFLVGREWLKNSGQDTKENLLRAVIDNKFKVPLYVLLIYLLSIPMHAIIILTLLYLYW